ncbi:hypothetical protein IE53DRAFT_215659 [Violaceomyces palustris]|uniref:Uncharacterized protein n=1 Tax=Violaceomyces palustris TaxID=1673888 RepID=A0ACD0NQD0_9BASI|nr:hypothetical protein IE53DRAFT_215659 [Violaceomyces palustris]
MISETAYNSECQLRDLSFGREPVEVPLLETSNLQRDSLLANFQEYTPVCVIHASYTLEIRERLSASHARRCNDSQQEDEGRSDDGDDVVRDSSCDSQDASTSQGCLCLAECGSLLHDRTDREPRSKKRRTSSPPFDEAMVTCLPGSACGCVEEYGNFYSWISTLNRSQEKKDDGEDDEKRSRRVAILNFEAIPPKHVLRECDSSCDCLKSSSNRAGLVAWSESHETKIYGGGRMPTSPGRRASDAEEDTALRRPLRGIRCANRVVGAGLGWTPTRGEAQLSEEDEGRDLGRRLS